MLYHFAMVISPSQRVELHVDQKPVSRLHFQGPGLPGRAVELHGCLTVATGNNYKCTVACCHPFSIISGFVSYVKRL